MSILPNDEKKKFAKIYIDDENMTMKQNKSTHRHSLDEST